MSVTTLTQVDNWSCSYQATLHRFADRPLTDAPIPGPCLAVAERALSLGHGAEVADQLTVNRYLAGQVSSTAADCSITTYNSSRYHSTYYQGIPPHVDTHNCATATILSLSLASGVLMVFRSLATGRQVPVWLPPRSLLVMRGEAR